MENKLPVGVVKEHRNILSEFIKIRRTHKLFYIDDKESQEVSVYFMKFWWNLLSTFSRNITMDFTGKCL